MMMVMQLNVLLVATLLAAPSTDAFVPHPKFSNSAHDIRTRSTAYNAVPLREPSIVDMGTDTAQARQVYDAWAEQYEQDIRRWGYELPERMAILLKQYLPPTEATTVLDTGAGDGLSGMALQQVGYKHIQGDDLSPGMLQIAKHRGCYEVTRVVDLSKPLPYDKDSFDAVTCIGTLTYVEPTAGTLQEFVRVTKPGGYILYSNRNDKADKWRDEEKRLETLQKWAPVQTVGPIPYLPKNPEFGNEVEVTLYLYRVL